jgi:hypothetical protein
LDLVSDLSTCLLKGWWYAIPLTLTVQGLILFHCAAFSCYTFYDEKYYNYFGYFSYNKRRTEDCVWYRPPGVRNASIFWSFGRIISVIGSILIWAIFAAVMAAAFYEYRNPRRYFLLVAIGMGLVACISLSLILGFLQSPSFQMSFGSTFAIVSAVVWSCAAVSMMCCMKKRYSSDDETGDSENTQTDSGEDIVIPARRTTRSNRGQWYVVQRLFCAYSLWLNSQCALYMYCSRCSELEQPHMPICKY